MTSKTEELLRTVAESFIQFGEALKDQNTSLQELVEKAHACGLDFQFRITTPTIQPEAGEVEDVDTTIGE